MAKSQADQIKELTAALAELDAKLRVLTERVENLQKEFLRWTQRVDDYIAKVVALEERSRHQEKQSDRGWQLWLAALGFGFGLLNLFITAALQLRK